MLTDIIHLYDEQLDVLMDDIVVDEEDGDD